MFRKWFDIQSAIKWTTQRNRGLFRIASTVVSIHNKIVMWCKLVENRLFRKKQGVLFKKGLCLDLKNVMSCVPLCCHSSFPVICGSRTWLENSWTLTLCARLLLGDISLLLAVQVCVMPLDSSSMFCSCSVTYATTENWSILTTDHAHFCIP